MARILLVEDEEKIARFVQLELEHEGYDIALSYDGRDALDKLTSQRFDLCLLDIMLPEINGLEVLRRLRRTSQLPVIMLTARDAVMDKVSGLDLGADDYITKPFAIEELLARIRAALRKGQKPAAASALTCGALRLEPDTHRVFYGESELTLTGREFDLLAALMENQNLVLSRQTLLDKVWGYDYVGETNVVDVYIRFLRSKIDEPFGAHRIHTVRGVGYTLREETT